jgi:hypothetical protein
MRRYFDERANARRSRAGLTQNVALERRAPAASRLDIKLFLVLQHARLRAWTEFALLTYPQDRLRDHRVAPGEPQASNSIFATTEIAGAVGTRFSAS